jgi:hypothetical protein
MTDNSSSPLRPVLLASIIGSAALAGGAWGLGFEWWARGPSLWWFEKNARWFGLEGPGVVFSSDLIFSGLTALLLSQLFLRLLRPDRYLQEALAIPVFLAGLFGVAEWYDPGAARFFLYLPALWLFLALFSVIVGYGIKAERQRAANPGR